MLLGRIILKVLKTFTGQSSWVLGRSRLLHSMLYKSKALQAAPGMELEEVATSTIF